MELTNTLPTAVGSVADIDKSANLASSFVDTPAGLLMLLLAIVGVLTLIVLAVNAIERLGKERRARNEREALNTERLADVHEWVKDERNALSDIAQRTAEIRDRLKAMGTTE